MDFMILKVNGQDLSKASHEEAVEAFRAAKEPIVVEVLRRTSAKPSASKMKSRSPTMVSIATQTEEDFYCYNRPPTPPPGFYPINISGLYTPASRRPVAFSPSAEMGLTDIEMAHGLDYEDTYFDDRHYEMEYEEVVLHRSSSDEKLGLTLCYGSADDEQTDIFISEVDPSSSAGKDGRIREGDQILQINGVDVHTRDQAIRLFSEPKSDIVLLVARPQLQCDDGFMEEPNLVLDDLHMEMLEKQHHDNMQFMASMLARRHVDEEGGTTDTATTENSGKHEKDSGVGRTDESTRNDESSEQENFDCDSVSALVGAELPEEIPAEACREFRHVLERRCLRVGLESNGLGGRKDSESSIERELALLNREMEEIQIECQEIVDAHNKDASSRTPAQPAAAALTQPPSPPRPAPDTQRSPRIVPRMGTRLEYMKHLPGIDPSELWLRRSAVTGVRPLDMTASSGGASGSLGASGNNTAASSSSGGGGNATTATTANGGNGSGKAGAVTGEKGEKDTSTTSAYNTGDSCRSTPLMLELNSGSDDADRGFKNSMLCLATPTNPPSTISPPSVPPSSSDTEKQTQTPTKARDYSSDESAVVHHRHAHGSAARMLPSGGRSFVNESVRAGLQDQVALGESLQDLYMRYADVMYTNRANLEHTMAIQQKLFQQQMEQKQRLRHKGKAAAAASAAGEASNQPQATSTPSQPSDSGQMEWVVKRRPDGTRYITRRPVRNKILKERAKKLEEERCGMTTDDDAMSELKTGRYWTKEERKRHLEKARDYKRRKETMIKARMETLKESEEKKEVNIVELSHRKMMKHKGKKVFDDFVTVQEMLAHGSRVSQGKTYNPLLSVTTV